MDAAAKKYYHKLLYKVAMSLVIIGALNWGLIGAFRINLVDRLFGKNTLLSTGVYVLVGLAALSIAFYRDTYLPFLGETVFPIAVLQDQTPPGATRAVTVKAIPNAKVVYWASEPGDEMGGLKNYRDAYGTYLNAGVATADVNGFVTLKVREPQPYSVPFKGRLEPHIHYRCCGTTGFLGRIKTVYVKDGRIEEFTDYRSA